MKPTTDTPDLLIVENRPWLIGLLLAGAVLGFSAAGVFALLDGRLSGLFYFLGTAAMMLFFHLFVRRTQAVFHRPESWVELRQRSLTRYTAVRHDLADVERAIVETSHDSDGGATHRVALMMRNAGPNARLPLTLVYSSGYGSQHSVEAINAWLDSGPQRS